MKRLCEILALAGNIAGAMLVALSQNHAEYGIVGYIFFLIGNVTSLWLLRHSNASNSLTLINIYFIIANVVGIATRIHW